MGEIGAAERDRGGRDRGRDASRPAEIPSDGWFDIAVRVKSKLERDNVSLLAAGVGLFALLAAFPALGAIVSIYGLFASSGDVAEHLQSLTGLVPADGLEIFRSQLGNLTEQRESALGIGAAVSLSIALWSARRGMLALMQACNVAYGEYERRGFFRRIAVSLAFTAGAIVYFIGTLAIGAAVPVVVEALFGDGFFAALANVLRWAALWLFIVLALAAIYRYAPSRRRARWRWVSWGAASAGTLWVVAGVLFEVYVRSFGAYGDTYGALGGVVVLLLWLYLSGFVVVLGALVNAEIEHQTARDSTTGPERPIGQRGAHVADTVGRARS